MKPKPNNSISLKGKSIYWFAALLIIIGFSRHLPLDYPNLLNFSPVLAIFLISGSYIKGKFSLFIPVIAVIISDLSLRDNYSTNIIEPFMAVTLASYLLIFFLGRIMSGSHSSLKITGTSMLSALAFHVITCSFAWIVNPVYTKSLTGLLQSIFIGEAGYAPSYLFLRNSMLSTAIFSLVLAYIASSIAQSQTKDHKIVSPSDFLITD